MNNARERVLYDLDPLAAELWVVEGPRGHRIDEIDPNALPDGFRFIEDEEWPVLEAEIEVVKE